MILLRVCVVVIVESSRPKDKHSFARWSLVRRVAGTKLEDDSIFGHGQFVVLVF